MSPCSKSCNQYVQVIKCQQQPIGKGPDSLKTYPGQQGQHLKGQVESQWPKALDNGVVDLAADLQ